MAGGHRSVVAVVNQKGGVGKTTTAVSVASCIASASYPTLLVDLDAQCNASLSLGVDRRTKPSLYEWLAGEAEAAEVIRRTGAPDLYLAPGSPDLAGAAVELPAVDGWHGLLARKLECVRGRFSYTLVDCPPSLGPLTVMALAAANRVVVPVQSEFLALEGLAQLLETVAIVRKKINPDLEVAGMVLTMHSHEMKLAREIAEDVRKHFKNLVFETVIPRHPAIAEAPSHSVPVIEHAPASSGAHAYFDLTKELVGRV